MDTSTTDKPTILNHIIAQLYIFDEKAYIRLQPVCHTDDFKEEYKKVYGLENLEHMFCFYNSAKWYSRLLDDFKYKKFKNMEFEKITDGIWHVPGKIETLVPWFQDTFIIYLKNKLKTYNEEEDEEPLDLLNYLHVHCKEIAQNMHHSIKREFDETFNCYKLRLIRPEKVNTLPPAYVLTQAELVAILLSYDSYKLGPALTMPVTSFKLWKDEYYMVNQTTFTENDIINHLDVLGIKKYDFLAFKQTDYNYKDIRSGSLLLPNTLVSAMHQTGKYKESISEFEDPIYGYEKDVLGCDLEHFENVLLTQKNTELIREGVLINNTLATRYLDTKVNFEFVPPAAPAHQKLPYYIYLNNITKDITLHTNTYTLLTEMHLLTTVNLYTSMAYELLKTLCTNLYKDFLLEDMHEIANMLDKTPFAFIKEKEQPVKESTDLLNRNIPQELLQKHHTQKYVEDHKDDSIETAAALVMQKVSSYLQNFIELNKININQIGKDLVELGVKKVRRSRGFLYGLNVSDGYVNKNKKQIHELLIDETRESRNQIVNEIYSQNEIKV